MKNVHLWGISIGMIGVLLCTSAIAAPTVVRFDDVTTSAVANPSAGYGGLNWTNFGVVNAANYYNNPSGYFNGMVSEEYVAFNHNGSPASFSAVGDPITLVSAYLTAAWNDGLTIRIQGYLDGIEVYSRSVVVNTTGPTLEVFNWVVDKVYFVSSGGTPAFANRPNGSTQFAMDNLKMDCAVVPAPGAVLLGSLGMGLVGWMRRRRAL